MHLTDIDLFYWVAGFIGHLALLLVLWRRHRSREFPIFTAWVASNLARTITLALVAHTENKEFYYYAYWSLAIIDTTLQLGIVYEMYSLTFRPLGQWAADVRSTLVGLLLGSVAIAAVLTGISHPQTRLFVEMLTIRGNLFSSVWMSELFVAMITLAVKVGLPWKTHVANIAQGLGVYSLFGVMIETANSYFGLGGTVQIYNLLSHCRMTLYLGCLVYWIVMLWKDAPDTSEMSRELRLQLIGLRARVERDLETIRPRRHR
ncbi:MAG: hypothetical protein WA634_20580 [Silvibacterium sp.]